MPKRTQSQWVEYLKDLTEKINKCEHVGTGYVFKHDGYQSYGWQLWEMDSEGRDSMPTFATVNPYQLEHFMLTTIEVFK